MRCSDTIDAPLGPGFEGTSEGFVHQTCNLNRYAGDRVLLSFRYVTDGGVVFDGFWVDNVEVGGDVLHRPVARCAGGIHPRRSTRPTCRRSWSRSSRSTRPDYMVHVHRGPARRRTPTGSLDATALWLALGTAGSTDLRDRDVPRPDRAGPAAGAVHPHGERRGATGRRRVSDRSAAGSRRGGSGRPFVVPGSARSRESVLGPGVALSAPRRARGGPEALGTAERGAHPDGSYRVPWQSDPPVGTSPSRSAIARYPSRCSSVVIGVVDLETGHPGPAMRSISSSGTDPARPTSPGAPARRPRPRARISRRRRWGRARAWPRTPAGRRAINSVERLLLGGDDAGLDHRLRHVRTNDIPAAGDLADPVERDGEPERLELLDHQLAAAEPIVPQALELRRKAGSSTSIQ